MRNLKIGHLEKAIARAKAIVFAKYSVQVKKFKYTKNMRKTFVQTHSSSMQKTARKNQLIFEK